MRVMKESDMQVYDAVGSLLETGGVLIFPTDTVYGIGGSPWDERALALVRRLKGRKNSQPFTLHLPSVEAIGRFAILNEKMRQVLDTFLPGPITFILPARDDAPAASIIDGKVGVRVPANPFFQAVMRKLDRPLFGTSVNRSGEAPLMSIDTMIEQFSVVDLLIEGNVGTGVPSAIVDLTGDHPRSLRGALPEDLS